MGFLLAPIHVPRLQRASRIYRWYFLILACSIYGSTGWLKVLVEPGWWSGEVLGQALASYGLDDDERIHAARTLRSAFHGFAHLEAGDGHPPCGATTVHSPQ